jgi:hypothetical protein
MPPSTTISHLLTDVGNVTRLDEISKGSGRFEKAWATIASSIRWRVWTASAKEMALAQQLRMQCTHIGYTEPDQDVAKDDVIELTIKDGNPIDTQYFRVQGVQDPSLVHHRKLILERITIGKEA